MPLCRLCWSFISSLIAVLTITSLAPCQLNGGARSVGGSPAADGPPAAPSGLPARRAGARDVEAVRIFQGRLAGIDTARQEVVIRGMLTDVPSAQPDAAAPTPGRPVTPRPTGSNPSASQDRNPADPARQRDPFQADTATRNEADLTGSGRTGNAPARVFALSFKVLDPTRVTLNGRPARLADLRPDLFVRVTARRASVQPRAGTGVARTATESTDLRPAQPGIGGTNTGASDGRTVGMVAESVAAFTAPPHGFPARPDPPRSGPLGTR